MPNPDPASPRFAAIARGERAPTARVGDSGQTLAELPRAEATRYATQLELAARAGDALTLLAESSDEGDEDFRALEDTLDAFDRWHAEVRARHRA
jgi:hypothetical protein